MKTAIKTISLLLICSMLSSCFFLITGGVKRKASKKLTVSNGAIPEYLGRYNATMLVEKQSGEKHFNKNLERIFENYNASYIVIEEGDESQEKYQDTEKFRYIFRTEVDYSNKRASDGSTVTVVFYHYSIYDRKNKVEYKAEYTHSLFTKVLKAYIENMNEEIDANR